MLHFSVRPATALFVALCLLFSTTVSASNIRALAEFKHLNKPLYFAAVYSERSADSLTAWRDNSVKREMEYRFTAERISTRSFSRKLLERILINNDSQELDRHSDGVQRFVQATRQAYEKGDRIQVLFHPDRPVEVQINTVTVAVFKDKGIFNILLNGWIGEKLQSQLFYKELSGELSEKKLKSYDRLILNAKRVSWAKNLNVIAPGATEPKAAATKPQAVAAVSKATQPVAKVKPQAKPKIKPAAKPEASVAKTLPKPVRKPVTKPVTKPAKRVATKPPPVKQKKPVVKAKPVSTAPRQVASIAKKAPVTQAPKKNAAPKKPSMSPLIRELFVSYLEELEESIGRKVTPSPPRSLRRVGKGDMVVEVTVNRKGVITDARLKENPLGDEMGATVKKALLKVNTLPEAPQMLPQKNFKIETVFNFKRCKRSPMAWICF